MALQSTRRDIILAGAAALAGSASAQTTESRARLLFDGNAYNPIPSSDGKHIAFVATGWGQDGWFGLGRASLVSNVALIDSVGRVSNLQLGRGMFLAGWTSDSKAVICYHDSHYAVVTPTGLQLEGGSRPNPLRPSYHERVAFLPDAGPVWIGQKGGKQALQSKTKALVPLGGRGPLFCCDPLIAPSPNGRFIAMTQTRPGETLWVYDRKLQRWAHLGAATISPSADWSYMQPPWDPWFHDSSQLVFFSGPNLIICSPCGLKRRVLRASIQPAGLGVPSPNGEFIACATFQSRPVEHRPDLKFWANTSVCVIPVAGGKPRTLMGASPDTTLGLRWHGNGALVFDRVGEDIIQMHARIWIVPVL